MNRAKSLLLLLYINTRGAPPLYSLERVVFLPPLRIFVCGHHVGRVQLHSEALLARAKLLELAN
jgi:hypothetical protein